MGRPGAFRSITVSSTSLAPARRRAASSITPLAISTGAGAESRHAIGTGVIGGMIAATVFAIFLVPVFFVAIRRVFPGRVRQRQEGGHE